MRTLKAITILIVFILSATFLQAQSVEEVFESYWEGGSKSLSNLTDDDYVIAQITMYDVEYNSSYDTFTATMTTNYTFGDDSYSCKTRVKGKYFSSSSKVTIEHDKTLDYDYLPEGLYWTHPDVYLTIYNDTDCDGYFGMVGQSEGQSGEDEYFALSNCPSY